MRLAFIAVVVLGCISPAPSTSAVCQGIEQIETLAQGKITNNADLIREVARNTLAELPADADELRESLTAISEAPDTGSLTIALIEVRSAGC